MPVMKVQPNRIILGNSKVYNRVMMPKKSITFPQSGVLSRSKSLKDYGGPNPNEVPDDFNGKEMIKKGAAGAAGGAVVGAIIGSIIPFVGTALGAWTGAAIAGAFGATAGAASEKD